MSQIFSSAGSGSPSDTFSWEIKDAGESLTSKKGYISTSNTDQDFPLPTDAVVGSVFELTQEGDGLVTITQGASQTIRFGNLQTTVGIAGSLRSTSKGDAIKIVCVVEDVEFQAVTGSIGNWQIS